MNILQSVDYDLEELRAMITKPKKYEPVLVFNNKPIHEILDEDLIPGEYFRTGEVIVGNSEKKYPFIIEASNFGRVRLNGKIP